MKFLSVINCDQPKICEQKWIANEDKLKVVHHRIDGLEEKVNDLSNINSVLVELKLLSEQNIESNKTRDEMIKLHSESLIQITSTLTNLNEKLDVTGEKIEDLETNVAVINSDNTFKITSAFKYIATLLAGGGVTYLFTLIK